MVGAAEVVRELNIPRTTLLRLAREGRIPAEEQTKPWHTNRHFRFKVSEVRQALERLAGGHGDS